MVEPHEYPDRYVHEIPNDERWMYLPADQVALLGEEAHAAAEARAAPEHYGADIVERGLGFSLRGVDGEPHSPRSPASPGSGGSGKSGGSGAKAAARRKKLARKRLKRKGRDANEGTENDPRGRVFVRVVPGVRVVRRMDHIQTR